MQMDKNCKIHLLKGCRVLILSVLLAGLTYLLGNGTGMAAPAGAGTGVAQSSPYDIEIIPLQPAECGRCHRRYFDLIKNEGGRHKINCRRCHVQFHIYRPGKVSYEEILPKCTMCHGPEHGEKIIQCSKCHSEVHSPLSIPASRYLAQGCHVCHPEVDKEIKTYITFHTELYCTACHHTRHGYIPECQECHQPHGREMTQEECLLCHPPHQALQVVYPEDISSESCALCHQNAYEVLRQSGTKHAALPCSRCHPEKHRTIMRCRNCHNEPHGDWIHRKFRACGQCHGIAHNLGRGG